MIEIAGGINQISKTGDHSRRLEFQEIAKLKELTCLSLDKCNLITDKGLEEVEKLDKLTTLFLKMTGAIG